MDRLSEGSTIPVARSKLISTFFLSSDNVGAKPLHLIIDDVRRVGIVSVEHGVVEHGEVRRAWRDPRMKLRRRLWGPTCLMVNINSDTFAAWGVRDPLRTWGVLITAHFGSCV